MTTTPHDPQPQPLAEEEIAVLRVAYTKHDDIRALLATIDQLRSSLAERERECEEHVREIEQLTRSVHMVKDAEIRSLRTSRDQAQEEMERVKTYQKEYNDEIACQIQRMTIEDEAQIRQLTSERDQARAELEGKRRESCPPTMSLRDLVANFIDCGNELRYRVMDMPNAMYEDQSGECRHDPDGCSWRRERRTGAPRPPHEHVRAFIRERVGPALFAVLDGYGDDVTTITERRSRDVESKTYRLPSGGEVGFAINANLLQSSKDDREFVFSIIDALAKHCPETQAPGSDDAPAEPSTTPDERSE